MTDIALPWNNLTQSADIAVAAGDLAREDGFATAITLSLFTDRRASLDDVLPDGSGDRRGWWGDAFAVVEGDQIGSKLWLLERSKLTPETLRRVKEHAQDALAWMVTDKIASAVEVMVERRAEDQVAVQVRITKPDGNTGQYDYLWNTLK